MTNPIGISDEERDMPLSEFMARREEEHEILEMFRALSPDEQCEMLQALAAGTQEALDAFGEFLRQSRGLSETDFPHIFPRMCVASQIGNT